MLYLILEVTLQSLFAPQYSRFLIRSTDLPSTKRDKMRVMLELVNDDNYQPLLREFIVSHRFKKSLGVVLTGILQVYAEDTDVLLISDAINGIGHIAKTIPNSVPHCLSALMDFIKYGSGNGPHL